MPAPARLAPPTVGIGVWQLEGERAVAVVREALDIGYRVIDTASAYGNEEEVGRAVAASPVDRSDVTVVTKIWMTDFDRVEVALDESRRRLQLDTLDVVLLHWPVPSDFDRTIRAFDALLAARAAGRVREVGVSNFLPDHVRQLTAAVGTGPSINQIETHPYFADAAAIGYQSEIGVRVQAHSPLGGQASSGPRPMGDRVITDIADELGATPAQVVLAWHLQRGVSPLPRASSAARLSQNYGASSFALTESQRARIDRLDRRTRRGPDPRDVHDTTFG